MVAPQAATKLAQTMAAYLQALTLDRAGALGRSSGGIDTAVAAGSAGTSLTAAGRGASPGGASAASVGGTDSELEEFDRAAAAISSSVTLARRVSGSGSGSHAGDDARSVPPCYKAEHAAGRKLRYLLHYSLTRLPPTAPGAG